jgi:hypothetical protein
MTLFDWQKVLPFIDQILIRKLQAVYAYGAIALVFWILTVIAAMKLGAIMRNCQPRKFAFPVYIIVVGMLFFGPFSFTHSTLLSTGFRFLASMLWSWILAAAPLYLYWRSHRTSITAHQVRSLLWAFPLTHTLMTITYLLFPIVLIE